MTFGSTYDILLLKLFCVLCFYCCIHCLDYGRLICLFDPPEKVSVMTLRQAERLAKRRDLKLVLVEDSTLKGKVGKQVYKLMTGKQYYEEEVQAKKDIKTTTGAKVRVWGLFKSVTAFVFISFMFVGISIISLFMYLFIY